MAYGQWFSSMQTAWEDVYRQRLADAHNRANPGEGWQRNDITSEFFNTIRLIRNDFTHKNGICTESSEVEGLDWLIPGKLITPSPMQMMRLLDRFPHDELRRTPVKQPEPRPRQLRYNFDAAWVDQLEAHVAALSPSKRGRGPIIQRVLDEWMKTGQENTAS